MVAIKKPIWLFFFGVFLFTKTGFSQSNFPYQYSSISRITPNEGLSQASNYFRYEDSRGFMWITGNDAMNRYDGKMMKIYNLSRYFKDCPELQQGYGFAEDAETNIYIGSTRGLYIYHRNTDKFTLQPIFKSPDATAMPFACKNGKVWCFNRFWQISTYDISTKKVETVTQFNLTPIASVHIYEISGNVFYFRWPFIDKQNTIWCIAENNIASYNIDRRTTTTPAFENRPEFFSAAYDSLQNKILLGTGSGIIEYDIYKRESRNIIRADDVSLGLIGGISISKNIVALYDLQYGLIFSDRNFEQVDLLEPGGRSKYFRGKQLSFDKSERLWMTDDGNGQIIFDFNPRLLNKFPGEHITNNYLKSAGVSNFSGMPDNNIMIPVVFDNAQWGLVQDHLTKAISYKNLPFLNQNLGFRSVEDSARKGNWFFLDNNNTGRYQYYFLDNKNHINSFLAETALPGLGQQQDLEILPDATILCSFSKGLYWLDPLEKKLEAVASVPQLNPFKINILSRNRLAISYIDNSMMLVNHFPGKKLTIDRPILTGIQSFYLQEDISRNRYWVGTNKGIYLLDKDFKTLRIFDANNGLAGTYIYGLLLDDNGNAWCSHQHGLSSIDAVNFKIINYDKSDGIQDWDFNNRAFYKSSDGTLYFGGVSGFNYFKPPVRSIDFYKPEVYVDEIKINDKTFLPDSNANFISTLNLSSTQNNIAVQAVVKDLANANARELIYRLKETDNKWKHVSNNSIISFNSLAPGNYTLELGTFDKYSNEEIAQKIIRIRIATPFYQKTWFWILCSIIVTALLLGLYTRRKWSKQKIVFRQQLALEQQRSKITADLHDDIGASLSSLQLNSAVANRLLEKDPGEVSKVLNKIETQSKDLADKIGDIIWSMKPGKDEFMTISSRIKNFATDILSAADIDYDIQIDKDTDTRIKDITVRKNIVLIFKEAINNAAKYSKATLIKISLQIKGERLLLSVVDNGAGFIVKEMSGNGIMNMRKRTEELKGNFILHSSPGNGTAVMIEIPFVP